MSFKLPDAVANISQTISNISRMSDGRFFQTTKRGEIHELKEDLHSANKDKKKDAVKKVIAAMTVGKDISNLFPDVVNCMQTTNIELKKLVYLYVVHYAKAQPELAILAVNTFRKDSLDANPLIRALAVRTMGCIRLEQITEFLVEPLHRACKDSDPYVRKTAAICVAKLYDTSPETVEDQGFFDVLQDMLGDSNPMVVSNAVAALSEISEISGRQRLKLNDSTAAKLLSALNQCTEWGQVFILDALARYVPKTSREIEDILERVTARMSHANAAVVMSAIKVVMMLLECTNDPSIIRSLQKKMSAPLVTLLSAEPEICYVALRNTSLIVQKRPGILAGDVKIFFCKYNDPIYVKVEKLEIIVRLASERNIDQVLAELKEYATEVDIDFVRRAVRAIGRCAIKFSSAAQKCINVLLELIQTKVSYIVQEATVVIKDIFRKYPNRYEQMISELCSNLESLDEPEAKASVIWIIGEYAERIDNAQDLLDKFLDTFHDEPSAVQMQILTAGVKLFLKNPKSSKSMVTRLLKMSTEEVDNPDLRDRGYIYWRLLSSNPEATRLVVLSVKPPISEDSYTVDPLVLDELIKNISMLASVYQKPPSAFVMSLRDKARAAGATEDSGSESDSGAVVNAAKIGDKIRNASYLSGGEEDDDGNKSFKGSSSRSHSSESSREDSSSSLSSGEGKDGHGSRKDSSGDLEDLIDLGGADGKRKGNRKRSGNKPAKVVLSPLLKSSQSGTQGKSGLEVDGGLCRHKGVIELHLKFHNKSTNMLTNWAIQINKNAFGLAVTNPLTMRELSPGASAEAVVKLTPNENNANAPLSNPLIIQIAIRTSLDIFYMNLTHDISPFIVENSPLSSDEFTQNWEQLQGQYQAAKPLVSQSPRKYSTSDIKSMLASVNIKLVSQRSFETHDILLFSFWTTNNICVLLEILLQNPSKGNGVKITFRSSAASLRDLTLSLVSRILKLQTS